MDGGFQFRADDLNGLRASIEREFPAPMGDDGETAKFQAEALATLDAGGRLRWRYGTDEDPVSLMAFKRLDREADAIRDGRN